MATELALAPTMVWVATLMFVVPAGTTHPTLLFVPMQMLAGPMVFSKTVVTWVVAALHAWKEVVVDVPPFVPPKEAHNVGDGVHTGGGGHVWQGVVVGEQLLAWA